MTTEGAAPSGEKHRLAATKIAWSYSGWMNGRVCGELTDEIAAAMRLVEWEAANEEAAKHADCCVDREEIARLREFYRAWEGLHATTSEGYRPACIRFDDAVRALTSEGR